MWRGSSLCLSRRYLTNIMRFQRRILRSGLLSLLGGLSLFRTFIYYPLIQYSAIDFTHLDPGLAKAGHEGT